MSSDTLAHIVGGSLLAVSGAVLLGMAVFLAWAGITWLGIWWEDTGHPAVKRAGTRFVDAVERWHARKVRKATQR